MNDAQHFILEHFDTINNSPSHIYAYALPFSPPSSWIHKYYRAEPPPGVRVVKGYLGEWGSCSRTVFPNEYPSCLAYWKETIAVGLDSGDITMLDAITGSQVTIFSGHTDGVPSLTFSLDGAFLVSGSYDKNVKLWDVQTGGVVKTFCGHTDMVLSVSISSDCTTIASGSYDKTIRLWHVQAGDCFHVIDGFKKEVNSVSFFPTNPQLLISAFEDNTVQQWDINGCKIGPTHKGKGAVFSSDGTHFVSWGRVATVYNSGSGVVTTELQVSSGYFRCCCFSHNGELVVGGVDSTIYVWDITGSDPHLIETLVGHAAPITSLICPASPISASDDVTVKFWKIGAPSTVATEIMSTSPEPSPILSVSLQVGDGVVISAGQDNVAKTWDISTGLHKASFKIPDNWISWVDARLIDNRMNALLLIDVDGEICIWDGEKSKCLQRVHMGRSKCRGIRISGDGSKVFCLIGQSIQAWDIQTGEAVGKVELEGDAYLDPLCVDGSKIWVCFEDSSTQGWDFGISGSSPIPLSNTFPNRPHLNLIGGTRWETGPIVIKDPVTGKEVFQLVGRYAKPHCVQWDGHYLVAGYDSGEVLILDLNDALPQ